MNWNILLKDDANILLLVAHGDDEIIFCGGTMLLYPNYKWTVVVMTEGGGKETEFKRVMNSLTSSLFRLPIVLPKKQKSLFEVFGIILN